MSVVDESSSFVPPKRTTRVSKSELVSEGEHFERKVVGEPIAETLVVETESSLTTLTEEERTCLRTLLTCGRRERDINVLDHQVRIQTLKGGDELRIGLYTKPYQGTQFFARAYQIGVCAAGIKYVDSKPLVPTPLSDTPDPTSVFNDKVKVIEEHYPLVITTAYNEIQNLEIEFADLMKKLGKLPG